MQIFQAAKIDEALAQYLEEAAQTPTEDQVADVPVPVRKCPSCGFDMVLQNKREGNRKYIGCMGFPNCRSAVWLPNIVAEVEVSGESCPEVCNHIKDICLILQQKWKGYRAALT